MFEDQRHLLRNDYIHRIAVNSVFKKKKKNQDHAIYFGFEKNFNVSKIYISAIYNVKIK